MNSKQKNRTMIKSKGGFKMRNKYMLIGVVAGVLLASVVVVLAGTNFDSPSGPDNSASQMYTLEQIYDRINDGTAATKMTTFDEPDSGPAATMHDLNAIYDLASERSRPAKTGQTTSYATGDDGNLQKGVSWPNPRFTDNANGTVTDNLTGLIWLEDANCTIFFSGDSTGHNNRIWADALTAANSLASDYCSLTDGSIAGDWRLPNVRELQSLVHFGFLNPAVPNTAGTEQWTSGDPFTGVQSSYWSSMTHLEDTSVAWYVPLYDGAVASNLKTRDYIYVWPVRGGQ